MKKLGLILLLVLTVLISGCTYGPKTETISQPTATPITTTTPMATVTSTAMETSTAAVTPAKTAIEIKDSKFNPSTITIPKGTTVVWTQNDSTPHTVTSSAGMGFDSGTLNQGAIFSRIFNDVGTFSYGCSIHPAMKGTIIVTQ